MIMMKKLFGFVICILVSLPACSIPALADSNTKLITAVYGGFPFPGSGPVPDLIHNVSGQVMNIGKVPAYNISCTLTITGGFKNDINKTISYNRSELPAKRLMGVQLTGAYGFGPVTITLTVSATNANTTTRIVKGFQIGGFTWVPLTWIIPGILQNLIPWLNWHPAKESYDIALKDR